MTETSEIETVYINNVAERLAAHSDELLDFDGTEPELELPDREYKIYAVFHRLSIIIMIDDSASEREKHYCFYMCVKMGLHPMLLAK